MTDPLRIQLAYPQDMRRLMAVGNSQVLAIIRSAPDDDPLAGTARMFAQILGFELTRYTRPAMQRRISDDIPAPGKQILGDAYALVDPELSCEIYRRSESDSEHEVHFDPGLGDCHVVIPGLCEIHSFEKLAQFLERLGGAA